MTNETNRAKEQAATQMESIREMVAALNCDYDRMEELRDERDNWIDATGNTSETWSLENIPESEELAELEAAAGDCESREDAEQRIQEDPLSVQVRSGWYSPGETPEAEEFEILLCTGGPAVRILGELDEHNQPSRAWLEYKDWGTPWTEYVASMESENNEALLAYCSQFYFGE